MRDGVLLSTDLYRPAVGEPFPTLLLRTYYDNQNALYVDWADQLARAGYAVALQDVRGRYDSDGVWRPYVDETNDGHDTLTWLGRQPWCDGNVGTFGISYNAFTATRPAPLRSPYLKAVMPLTGQEDNFGHVYCDGVLELWNAMNFLNLGSRTMQVASRRLVDFEALFRRLPLVSALDEIVDRPTYREFISHPTLDEFWLVYSLKGRYREIEAPAYVVTGWYDNLLHEGFKQFRGWRNEARPAARAGSKLLVGPWVHYNVQSGGGGLARYGDLDFGTASLVDILALHRRWFDRWLRGVENGIDAEAPLRLFVMGTNVWRDEAEWPLARTRWTDYHLHSGGRANSLHGDGRLGPDGPGDEPSDGFDYDPDRPVPTLGGQIQSPSDCGPRDRRPVERRDDVLVYTSAVLEADLEVTGPVVLTLHAASSAPDTDFTATLVDVHPTGQAMIVCEGIRRARYRESLSH